MTEKQIQDQIRSISNKKWTDWLKIGGHWYTIEEYDSDGLNMILKSKTAPRWRQEISIDTPYNRYTDTWLEEAEVTASQPSYWRFDRSYYIY